MATTTWIAGSGDWNTASDWSNGVPTASVDAVFPGTTGSGTGGPVTVTGDGPAASITVTDGAGTGTIALAASTSYTLTGSHTAAMLTKTGASALVLSGSNIIPGGLEVYGYGSTVELAAPGAGGAGPVSLEENTLVVDAGATVGPVTAMGYNVVAAVDASLLVFNTLDLSFVNGSGHSTVVGGTGIGASDLQNTQASFGGMSVYGGSGSVTVFGGDQGGTIYGGRAGNNVVIAGAGQLGQSYLQYAAGYHQAAATPVTIVGGGSGDLLVLKGVLNGNMVVAGAGNETLTGADANGYQNTFFGGTGADLIVAGAGHDLVVAGSGAETINAGTGQTAIFAGTGSDLIVGGSGADYVQVGAGSATAFTGAGADLFAAVNGGGGGSELVVGFRVGTDQIALRGYAGSGTMAGVTNSQVTGGSTVLTLADNTRITLQGRDQPGHQLLRVSRHKRVGMVRGRVRQNNLPRRSAETGLPWASRSRTGRRRPNQLGTETRPSAPHHGSRRPPSGPVAPDRIAGSRSVRRGGSQACWSQRP